MKDKGVDFVWFDGQYLKWEEAKVPIFYMPFTMERRSLKESVHIHLMIIYTYSDSRNMERLRKSAMFIPLQLNFLLTNFAKQLL